jgi:hypothetical protein
MRINPAGVLSLVLCTLLFISCKKDRDEQDRPLKDYVNVVINNNQWKADKINVTTDNTFTNRRPTAITAFFGSELITIKLLIADPGVYPFKENNNMDILPVTLLTFSGAATESEDRLTWSTGEENYIDRFEVENSPDGVNNWVMFRLVHPKGPNSDYEVFNNSQIGEETSFYRLNIIDQDKKSSYSKIIVIPRFRFIDYQPAGHSRRRGYDGQIQVTELNQSQHFIRGTFVFKARGQDGTLFIAQNGNFQVHY